MASSNPIIVGGGIASGSPFTLGHILYVSNVSPPQAATAVNALVTTDSVSAVQYVGYADNTGTFPSVTNAVETVRIQGGMIVSGAGTDSVAVGRGAAAAVATGSNGADTITIGRGIIGAPSITTKRVAIGALANISGGASVVLGYNSGSGSANPVGGVFIGDSAQASGNAGGANVVCIGDGALIVLGNSGGGGAVGIGFAVVISHPLSVTIGRSAQSSFSSATGQNTVTIGDGATSTVAGTTVIGGAASTTTTGAVVIGSGASATGGGSGSVVIGQLSAASAAPQIIIGASGASLGANIAQIGTPGTPITTFVLGAGDTAVSPGARTVRFTNASGTNVAAGNVTFIAPLSTGNATPANILFQVGTAGASGATLQTASTVLTLAPGAATVSGTLTVSGAATFGGAVTVAAGGSAALTLSTTGTDARTIYTRTVTPYSWGVGIAVGAADDSFRIYNLTGSSAALTINTANAATFAGALTVSGATTLAGGATLLATTTALTNGAAAQIATLGNSPTAGDPTKWIAINDAGTTRYIPAW